MKAASTSYSLLIIFAGFILFAPISANAQTITTVAGNGIQGYLGDKGPQTAAEFWNPTGVAVDVSGNIFIADQHNDRIRMVSATSDSVFTIAGDSMEGYYRGNDTMATFGHLYGPTSIVLDAKRNIYIADQYNNRIRKVSSTTGYMTTIAGNGKAGFSGDGLKADTIHTSFYYPVCVARDTSGNIFVVDSYNNRIREINAKDSIIHTIAGYTSDSGNTAIIDTSWGYSGDGGLATLAKFNSINAVTTDPAGNVYLVDGGNNCIRKIASATGIVTTIAGTGNDTSAYLGDGGPATKARLASPEGVAIDANGNIFIADAGNNVIRMVIAQTGIIRTVVGNGTAGYAGNGGNATDAELYNPMAMAFDAFGSLYIADEFNSVIRKVTVITGIDQKDPESKQVIVYPVPNKGNMTLKLNGAGYSSVHILNALGQSVYDLTISTLQQDQYLSINLPAAAAGMYVLQVISQSAVITRPILIQR